MHPKILETAYVARHKDGLFLSENGYTLGYTRTYAMFCSNPVDFNYYFKCNNLRQEDFTIEKIYLCQPEPEISYVHNEHNPEDFE